MSRFYGILLIILIGTAPVMASAEGRPLLNVSFEIAEQDYRDYFESNIQRIERECSSRIIGSMGKCFGFVQFTESPSSDSLIITLDAAEETTPYSQMREVGFKIMVRGSFVPSGVDPIYWMFRQREDYDLPLGTASGFATDVCISFENSLTKQRNLMVGRILSKIALAQDAFLIPGSRIWIVPLIKDSIGIGRGSEFCINAEISDAIMIIIREYMTTVIGKTREGASTIPPEYCGGMILAETVEPIESLSDVENPDNIQAIGVYIIQYVSPAETIKPTSPDELASGGEEVGP